MAKEEAPVVDNGDVQHGDVEQAIQQDSRLKNFYAHPWTQIILISVICFCCPGVGAQSLKFFETC